MRAKTLYKFLLLLSLASCKPVALGSPLETPTPSFTASPISVIPTATLTSIAQNISTVTPNASNLANYYGVWIITRYEQDRDLGVFTDDDAKNQIGKQVELTDTEIRFDDGFLLLENRYCANASYDWATPDDFIGHLWQALLPVDHPDKRDDLLFFHVNCDGNVVTGFEVTKTGKLVVFYVGYWFFLDQETSAT